MDLSQLSLFILSIYANSRINLKMNKIIFKKNLNSLMRQDGRLLTAPNNAALTNQMEGGN
jgi:hypothetical protein